MSTIASLTSPSASTAPIEREAAATTREDAFCQVWIDLDNSPHVPFFAPIIDELRARGLRVVVTARDCFQVRELADLSGLHYKLIGRHYGKHPAAKLAGLCIRACQMLPTVRRTRPAVAVSHGSRSQLLISKLLGMRSVMIGDYEFAKVSAGIHPDWMIVPQVIPIHSVSRPGRRILTYPGIKEDVYAPSFKPSPGLRAHLGLGENDLVVTVRPPATEAHYHVAASDRLFDEVMLALAAAPAVRVVLLPRNARQAEVIRNTYPDMLSSGRMVIPQQAVDGLNLVWHSDLVISGGGTMNREAAALGVPVYSIFRGKIGAVDQHLAQQGRLHLIADPGEIHTRLKLTRRARPERPPAGNSAT
ncbi:MAG TPA: DUF354 domain-containing protein, partial [Rhodopila sp.]